jgi:chemotaxis protein methyltransferase CheR
VSAGNELLRSRRVEEGLAAYAQARAKDPLCVEAHLFMGMAWHVCGEPEKAAADLRAALFFDPCLWPAEFFLGLSMENLGRGEAARRHFRRVLAMADQPLQIASVGSPLDDLDAWKKEVLLLCRLRADQRRHR